MARALKELTCIILTLALLLQPCQGLLITLMTEVLMPLKSKDPLTLNFTNWHLFNRESSLAKIIKGLIKSFNDDYSPKSIIVYANHVTRVFRINDITLLKDYLLDKQFSELSLTDKFKGFPDELVISIKHSLAEDSFERNHVSVFFKGSKLLKLDLRPALIKSFNSFFKSLINNLKPLRVIDFHPPRELVKKFKFKVINLATDEGLNLKPLIKGLEWLNEYRRRIVAWEHLVFDEWSNNYFLEPEDFNHDLGVRSVISVLGKKLKVNNSMTDSLMNRLLKADNKFKSITTQLSVNKKIDWWLNRAPNKRPWG